MAITIRLSEKDQKIIDELKVCFDETTTSKALLTAAFSYLALRESFQELSKEYAVVRDTLNELRDLEEQRQSNCNQIAKILEPGDVQYDGKIPCRSDQLVNFTTEQYLQKGLLRWN